MTTPDTPDAPVFSLLTDFGLADPYAGELRAELRRLAPSVPCLDLSHGVPPFAVAAGAFFLAAARPRHAAGTIFLCVVDPGVGSERSFLCVANNIHTLLGPDNGLLSLAARGMAKDGPLRVWRLAGTDGTGGTFHGRDILAPLAARIALGASPDRLGVRLDPDEAQRRLAPDWAFPSSIPGGFRCTVLHVDRFGNCILNLPLNPPLPAGGPLLFAAGDADGSPARPLQAVTHYAAIAGGDAGILPGSQGFYELACNRSSAAESLSLAPGAICRIFRGLGEKQTAAFSR